MNFIVDFSGLGAIGLRHLESLSLLPHNIDVILTDPSPACISKACKLLDAPKYKHVSIVDCDSLSAPDLSIVSTTSHYRRAAIESQLAKGCNTFILEKTLFTSPSDYIWASETLQSNPKITAWVNCARQTYGYYPRIKNLFDASSKTSSYTVNGSSWNICSNLIHHLDEYLSFFDYSLNSIAFDCSGLSNILYESKRPGYLELCGTLSAVINDSHRLVATTDFSAPFSKNIVIETDSFKSCINEPDLSFEITSNNSFVLNEAFNIPLQSIITSTHIASIMNNSPLPLPLIHQILEPHYLFIRSIHSFLIASTNYQNDRHCMIT